MVVDHRRTLTRLATTLNLERRNRFMKSKLFRFLSLVVITAITLGASPAHATRIRVVTTLTDLADLTRNVGGAPNLESHGGGDHRGINRTESARIVLGQQARNPFVLHRWKLREGIVTGRDHFAVALGAAGQQYELANAERDVLPDGRRMDGNRAVRVPSNAGG